MLNRYPDCKRNIEFENNLETEYLLKKQGAGKTLYWITAGATKSHFCQQQRQKYHTHINNIVCRRREIIMVAVFMFYSVGPHRRQAKNS